MKRKKLNETNKLVNFNYGYRTVLFICIININRINQNLTKKELFSPLFATQYAKKNEKLNFNSYNIHGLIRLKT